MRRTAIVLTLVAAVAGVAVWRARWRDTSAAVSVTRVETTPVLKSLVTASGEIVAARYAEIGANVMGRLVELAVKEGDAVKAGQILARIDPVQAASTADAADAALSALEAESRGSVTQVRAAQSAVDEARSRATESNSALVRAQQLRDSGLMPAADFDRTQATAGAAQAQLAAAIAAVERAQQTTAATERRVAQGRAERARARDQLSKTAITAPMSGVVTRLDVEEGEMVVVGVQNQPGTILMVISDLAGINAEVKVAEADVMRLAVGMPAAVSLEALPDARFTGRILEIGASALPQIGAQAAAREFRVKVRLDYAPATLRPGLTCDAEIVAAERRDVVAVPLQAVVDRHGRSGVFRLDGGVVRFVPVKTGIIGGLSIEVDGLAAGDQIASGPIQALRSLQDGTAVRIADAPR